MWMTEIWQAALRTEELYDRTEDKRLVILDSNCGVERSLP